jgi:hypothetical protein
MTLQERLIGGMERIDRRCRGWFRSTAACETRAEQLRHALMTLTDPHEIALVRRELAKQESTIRKATRSRTPVVAVLKAALRAFLAPYMPLIFALLLDPRVPDWVKWLLLWLCRLASD